MTPIRGRLLRLEARIQRGCDHYRWWILTVLIDDGATSRPEVCPAYGRAVPVGHYLHLVGVPLESV